VYSNNAFHPSLECSEDEVGLVVTYLVGENARDNHAIIDLAGEKDMWVHLKNIPSCHVIVQVPSSEECEDHVSTGNKRWYRDILRKATRQGGILCKQYSKNSLRSAGLSKSKVDIIAYSVGNVEKSAVPGQVFTHGDAITFSV
jgi:predicted ribosome quality control (RQC) complex YloA/Tae2 family protein